ncbi:MAG: hypothetical protein FD137_1230 [Spirochaetes bacterium]|nr:MAG: hypothetical protein FD137_1230 [Spirochaetota bacterium]
MSSQRFARRAAALPEETMGTSLVLEPAMNSGRFTGKPAPEKMMSIFSSMAVFTRSAKLVKATMMLTPRTPWLSSLARRISRLRARTLAPRKSLKPSGSSSPMPAAAMTPTPPALATAAASPEREIPTPMPPWTMGILAVRSPKARLGMAENGFDVAFMSGTP